MSIWVRLAKLVVGSNSYKLIRSGVGTVRVSKRCMGNTPVGVNVGGHRGGAVGVTQALAGWRPASPSMGHSAIEMSILLRRIRALRGFWGRRSAPSRRILLPVRNDVMVPH